MVATHRSNIVAAAMGLKEQNVTLTRHLLKIYILKS
jgi:hypothetical protein